MSTDAAPSNEGAISSPIPDREEWSESIVEPQPSADLERVFRRRVGFVPRMVPYLSPHPWVYRAVLFLVAPRLRALDEDLCMQVCFVVARENACRYCYGSLRTFLRVAGYSESELDRLEDELYLQGKQGPERNALTFALRISKGRLQHRETVTLLRDAGYSTTAIREMAGSALLDTLSTCVATMLAVPIDVDLEAKTASWYFDLLQPIVRPLLAGWQNLGASSDPPLSPEAVEGPFAPWLARLSGTHVGRLLHDLTDHWLENHPALSLRTKLLILAVVARALSQDNLTDRVRRLLSERCGLSHDAVETAVTHFRGDALSDRDAGLLRLARESVRYEPQRLQSLVPEHVANLSRAETIDAVATIGLSNALARLCTLEALHR